MEDNKEEKPRTISDESNAEDPPERLEFLLVDDEEDEANSDDLITISEPYKTIEAEPIPQSVQEAPKLSQPPKNRSKSQPSTSTAAEPETAAGDGPRFPDPKEYSSDMEYFSVIKKFFDLESVDCITPPKPLGMVGPVLDLRKKRAKASPEVLKRSKSLFVEHLYLQFTLLGLDSSRLGPRNWQLNCRNAYSKASGTFVWSDTRESLIQQALNVDLGALNELNFDQMLEGFFIDSPDSDERVLIIFYFCADLMVRAYQESAFGSLVDIYDWSIYYIETRLSTWVEQRGGWETIFPPDRPSNLRQYAIAFGVLCFGIVAMTILLRRRN